SVAEARYDEESRRVRGVSAPKVILLGSNQAFTFKTVSELGPDITHYVIERDESTVYDATVFVSNPAHSGYEETTRTILKTLAPLPGSVSETITVSLALL